MTRKDEMIEMRNQRISLQEIADKYELSRERVRQIIGNTGHMAYPTYTPELIQETITLRQQGFSADEIGKQVGRRTDAVRRILHRNNIPVRITNRIRLAEGKRKCARCQEIKDLSEFGKMKTDALGTNPTCKICNRANVREVRLRRMNDK